jgi:YihY family inner membrane protein
VLGRVDHVQRDRPWLSFPVAVVKKFGEDDAGSLAALVAYYGFFSIFPLLLAMVSVLGFALHGNEELQRRIVDSTMAQLPVVGQQISENVGSLRGSVVAVAIGLIAAIWAGLGVVQAMQKAMNSVWDVPMRERPNAIEARLRAAAMLLVFGLAMIATTLLASASTAAETFEPFDAVIGAVGSGLLNTAIYLVAFKVLTDRPLSWRELLPGAVVGGIAFTALQLVGGAIVGRNVRGASDTYGTFAVVIGLLAWLYLLGQLSVAAAEVNVVAAKRLWPRSLLGDELTSADRRTLRQHAEVEERLDGETVAVDLPADSDTSDTAAEVETGRADSARVPSAER